MRGKEQDLRFAEEAGQVANGEVARVCISFAHSRNKLTYAQMMHEQGLSEAKVKKLEEDLLEARQVRHSLDLQKLENGKLKVSDSDCPCHIRLKLAAEHHRLAQARSRSPDSSYSSTLFKLC